MLDESYAPYQGGENFFDRLTFLMSGGAFGKPSSNRLNSKLRYKEALARQRTDEHDRELANVRNSKLSELRAQREDARNELAEGMRRNGIPEDEINRRLYDPEYLKAIEGQGQVDRARGAASGQYDAGEAVVNKEIDEARAASSKAKTAKIGSDAEAQDAGDVARSAQAAKLAADKKAIVTDENAATAAGADLTPEQRAKQRAALRAAQESKENSDRSTALLKEQTDAAAATKDRIDRAIDIADRQSQNLQWDVKLQGDPRVRLYNEQITLGQGPINVSAGGGVYDNPAAGRYIETQGLPRTVAGDWLSGGTNQVFHPQPAKVIRRTNDVNYGAGSGMSPAPLGSDLTPTNRPGGVITNAMGVGTNPAVQVPLTPPAAAADPAVDPDDAYIESMKGKTEFTAEEMAKLQQAVARKNQKKAAF